MDAALTLLRRVHQKIGNLDQQGQEEIRRAAIQLYRLYMEHQGFCEKLRLVTQKIMQVENELNTQEVRVRSLECQYLLLNPHFLKDEQRYTKDMKHQVEWSIKELEVLLQSAQSAKFKILRKRYCHQTRIIKLRADIKYKERQMCKVINRGMLNPQLNL